MNKWTRAAIEMPSGVHMIKIIGTRGPSRAAGIALDDITLDDCFNILSWHLLSV